MSIFNTFTAFGNSNKLPIVYDIYQEMGMCYESIDNIDFNIITMHMKNLPFFEDDIYLECRQ